MTVAKLMISHIMRDGRLLLLVSLPVNKDANDRRPCVGEIKKKKNLWFQWFSGVGLVLFLFLVVHEREREREKERERERELVN